MSGHPPDSGLLARGRSLSLAVAERLDGSVLERLWARLLEVEFIDRAVALAAKGFVSLLPLIVVVAAFAPDNARAGILESLISRFGLAGQARELVRQAFASPDEVRSSTGVIGIVLTVLFAMSFTTAMQRIFVRAWRRPRGVALDDRRRGLVWLASTVAFLALVGYTARILTGPPGTVFSLLLGFVAGGLLWWWTAHTMLRGQVRWRPLLPTAVVLSVGSSIYTVAASVWMPRVVTSNVEQFGFVGVALSFVTWMVGFGCLIVGAAVLSPVLCEGQDRVAQWLSHDGVLVPGAAPSLPGPAAAPRLLDLLRPAAVGDDDV